MRELFWTFFSISISGSIMMWELIVLKPFIKHRLTKAFQYYIWLFIVLRLLIPFSFDFNPIGDNVNHIVNILEEIGTRQADNFVEIAGKSDTTKTVMSQINKFTRLSGKDDNTDGNVAILGVNTKAVTSVVNICSAWILHSLGLIWVIGVIILLIRVLYQYNRFVNGLKKDRTPIRSTKVEAIYSDCCNQLKVRDFPKVFYSPLANAPMLIGIRMPQIILPSRDYQCNELKYILLHELSHYKRHDILYKWLIQFTVCIHWFNPLVYLLSNQMKQAGELACDEAVIKKLSKDEKREYGMTLINSTAQIRLVTIIPAMSDSKKNLKDRLTAIMVYNKPMKKLRLIMGTISLLILITAVISNIVQPESIMAKSQELDRKTWGEQRFPLDETKTTKKTDKEEDKNDPKYTYRERLEQLKEFSEYGSKDTAIPYTYQLNLRDKYKNLNDTYNLDAVTSGSDDVELMMKLMNWVCDNFQHNGMSGLPKKRNAYEIIDFCKANSYAVNARGLSILLAELLRLYGISAKHITCMPKEAVFEDCNAVVHAYSEKYRQWIMLDPTYRLILKDENGQYVNLPMLREILIKDKPLVANDDAGRNGNAFDMEYYREYMTKNTFRFSCATDFGFGSEEGTGDNIRNMLIPLHYDEDYGQRTTSSEEAFWALP